MLSSGKEALVVIETKIKVDLTNSRKFLQEARRVAPGGSPDGKWWEPDLIYAKRAKAGRLTDIDGNEFIDYYSGAGPIILGHSHPEVNQAVINTIQNVGVQFALPHEISIGLAKKLNECFPCAEMSVFCNAGTDTAHFAVRTARTFTGRPKIVKFEGGYQGWADPVAMSTNPQASDFGPETEPRTVADTGGLPAGVLENTIVLPYNNLEVAAQRLTKDRSQIACVFVEPYIHGFGIAAKPNFLKGLREICTSNDILLIFDEIVTGFRHGLGGMQKIENVIPDMTILGKAMANGYPISALSGKRKYMESLFPRGAAFFSGTFNGNPVSTAASMKTIEILARPGFYETLYKSGDNLRNGISDAIKRLNIKARCFGYGSVWYLYFDSAPPENYRDVYRYRHSGGSQKEDAYRKHMLNRGVFIFPGRGTRSYINAGHTDCDIQITVDAAVEFLAEHQSALH
jgi:glutamate-1-semialdehyde 2,1-aminomutase